MYVSRGGNGRAPRDAVVGMWCSGGARCVAGWRRPARRPCPTISCGGWRGRLTVQAPPAASACSRPAHSPTCRSPSPAPSGSRTCATSPSCAACRSARTSSAATPTTGAVSANPVRHAPAPATASAPCTLCPSFCVLVSRYYHRNHDLRAIANCCTLDFDILIQFSKSWQLTSLELFGVSRARYFFICES